MNIQKHNDIPAISPAGSTYRLHWVAQELKRVHWMQMKDVILSTQID